MSPIVLLADEQVASLPIIECGEILCDLRDVPAIRLDRRRASADGAYAHLRTGVLDRLIAAQTLLPPGLRLLVIEGYRPIALQRRYFAEYCARLAAEHPSWTTEQVRERARRTVAAPEDDPHVTGAAVDLTVCAADGTELPMGTAVNATDDACYTAATSISPTERVSRGILGRALTTVGLVNYPTEWWHWSYGDRYWAFVKAHPHARYGPIDG